MIKDIQVVGEYFFEQTCDHKPINVTEIKTKPECFPMTKEVCEKMWIPEAPYWKDTNCETKTWQNCTLVPDLHIATIDYCDCKPTEIWYNKFEKNVTQCSQSKTSCVAKAVPVCETVQESRCITVEWEECEDTCTEECDEQHFKEPSQDADHRRWCSHVEIELPPGVTGPTPSPNSTEPTPIQFPKTGRAPKSGFEI